MTTIPHLLRIGSVNLIPTSLKIPPEEGVGMVNSPLVTQINYNSFATRVELKLPFMTRGKFMIPTPTPEGIEAILYCQCVKQWRNRC